MHTTNIRIAAIEDATAICAVVRRSITECCGDDHHNDPDLLAAWLKNKTVANAEAWVSAPENYAIVAEVDGAIVGFGLSQSAEILLCYIAPEVRHKGVGKSLLRAIEAHAASAGIAALHLESTRTAEAFYRRNGFEPVGPIVVVFGMEGLPMSKQVVTDFVSPRATPGFIQWTHS